MLIMPSRETVVVITAEHGGRSVPSAFATLFAGQAAQSLLDSHRGWDPGSLVLARDMAEALAAPLHASTTTRLLVDLNRSIGHPKLFSEFTRPLPRADRERIVADHYRPHRDAVEGDIDRLITAGHRVLHVASHSFTPVWNGADRRTDVAWLYDPRRHGECVVVREWMSALVPLAPTLRLRRNHPYTGRSDGLAAGLRRRHPDADYMGIELEVSQRFPEEGGAAWTGLRAQLVEALRRALHPASGGAASA